MARWSRKKRQTLRFPWEEFIPGIVLGLILGATIAIVMGSRLAVVVTPPPPFPEEWTYHYSALSLLVMVIVGVMVLGLGFIWRTDRQLWNYLIVGTGLGIGILGTSHLAMERIELTEDGFAHRGWWGLSGTAFRYDELQSLGDVYHTRQSWSRRRSYHSLHYQLQGGTKQTLCSNTNRSTLFTRARLHLGHAVGKHGITIHHEWQN